MNSTETLLVRVHIAEQSARPSLCARLKKDEKWLKGIILD